MFKAFKVYFAILIQPVKSNSPHIFFSLYAQNDSEIIVIFYLGVLNGFVITVTPNFVRVL